MEGEIMLLIRLKVTGLTLYELTYVLVKLRALRRAVKKLRRTQHTERKMKL